MWGFTDDLDRTFAVFDDFRRRIDRAFEGFDARSSQGLYGQPRTVLRDTGAELVLEADVPGLADKDIQITVTQDSLTIAGERPAESPEGYAVHRRERLPLSFSRSFALPVKIDADRASASVKNGVLTVTLGKAAEAKPRQITVKASA
jgi:HSP20 family protein